MREGGGTLGRMFAPVRRDPSGLVTREHDARLQGLVLVSCRRRPARSRPARRTPVQARGRTRARGSGGERCSWRQLLPPSFTTPTAQNTARSIVAATGIDRRRSTTRARGRTTRVVGNPDDSFLLVRRCNKTPIFHRESQAACRTHPSSVHSLAFVRVSSSAMRTDSSLIRRAYPRKASKLARTASS